MLDLNKENLKEIQKILSELVPECEVRAFGSRVLGKARPYSDLDLALVAPKKMDWRRIEDLKQAFSSSNIPFTVDVLDWHAISKEFQNLIAAHFEVIQRPLVK